MISRLDSKRAKVCKLDRSRRELSNEHLLATFGFDAAENEPLGVGNLTGIWEFGRVKFSSPIPKFPWELRLRTAGSA